MSSTLKRIKEYIDLKGITIQKFEKEVGFSNGGFGIQLKREGSIGVDKLENIITKYPDLNPIWVLTGKGEMLFQDENEVVSRHELCNEIETLTPDEKERVYSLIDLLIRDIKKRKL